MDEKIVNSPLTPLDIPEVPIHTALFANCQRFIDRVALIDGLSGQQFTYTEILAGVRRVGSALAKHGIKKGDVVAMYAYNCPEWVFIVFAALYAGASVTTINPTYTIYELDRQLVDSGAHYLFTSSELAPTAKRAAKDNPQLQDIFVVGTSPGCISIDVLLKDDGSRCEDLDQLAFSPKEDVAFLPYSSGTTGVPKGVMLTHFNIISNLMQMGHPELSSPEITSVAQTVLLVLPLYHAYGLIGVLHGCLLTGQSLVLLPKFEPHTFLRAIERFKVTALPLVPPLVIFMAKSPLVKSYDLSSLQRVGSGAAPLSHSTEDEFKKVTGLKELRQGYGMTETTCVASSNYTIIGKATPAGSSGVLAANSQGKIVDVTSGKSLGPRERGELWVRGPNIMKGYLNKPEATHETLDAKGWLHTGDIGYYDENGYFYIVDRMKELIKVKGLQVAPAELEALILTHPKVDDVGVTGVPDELAGELPRAYVVPKHGQTLLEQEIQQYVAERSAPFKHLKGGVKFLEVIPRLPSGKIIRRKLKEIAAQEVKSKL